MPFWEVFELFPFIIYNVFPKKKQQRGFHCCCVQAIFMRSGKAGSELIHPRNLLGGPQWELPEAAAI